MGLSPAFPSQNTKSSLLLLLLSRFSHVQLCDPIGGSPPGSSVHWISQTKILEWLPFPSPGDLPDLGIEPGYPELQADYLLSKPAGNLFNKPTPVFLPEESQGQGSLAGYSPWGHRVGHD